MKIGVVWVIGVVFVVMKLTGAITWSWWWVTVPFWGGLVLLVAAVVSIIGYLKWCDHREANRLTALTNLRSSCTHGGVR